MGSYQSVALEHLSALVMMSVILTAIKTRRNDASHGDNSPVIILVTMNQSVNAKLFCCFLRCYGWWCNDLMPLMIQGLLMVGF
jgi:hypothetical protein